MGAGRGGLVDRRPVHDRLGLLRARRRARLRELGRRHRRQRHVLRRIDLLHERRPRCSTSRWSTPIRSGSRRRARRAVRFLAWEPHRIDWWATAVQLVGTLFFNISTFAALRRLARGREGEPVRLATRRARVGLLPRRQPARVRGGRPPLDLVAAATALVVDRRAEPRRFDRLRRVRRCRLRRPGEWRAPQRRARQPRYVRRRARLPRRRVPAPAGAHRSRPDQILYD